MSSAHQNLVILLHGVGSNGADFAALGKALQGFLPDAAFAPPNATNPFDGGGLGRQWFSVVGVNAANRAERVEQARAGFDRIVAQEIEKAGFRGRLDRVALFGFSQDRAALKELNTEIMLRLQEAGLAAVSDTTVDGEHCLVIVAKREKKLRGQS